jgi:site-specific DNA-cytosine methylase
MGQRSGAARVLLEERRLSLDKSTIRRLTPLECERLQGFPDGWTDGLSDTQRYKTLGNAVTTNVVYEVIKRMYL